ncbi:ammonium transporter [Phycisphaera mikurensis]|uniref:Ammonium transporter n=1 Tax=Phycisphaera mikurensis (strain NBRC 102666 / KCTC 22515 / FYK2301M01) TaxID=1142394 RepID=I0ICG0_PHYMF|nr:ammonium transporter [Phycisphaera mikurensis]MBB6442176.1 Amt family ammonium transporter [Phycisphaera mikurensis]BAM02948.1 putative ammonium transporter [Phycisphaera mikurensis NBRC 102666]
MRRTRGTWLPLLGVGAVAALFAGQAMGQDEAEAVVATADSATQAAADAAFMTNNLWILIAAVLVFSMHLGFGCLEAGLTRAKNTVNILTKNTMIVLIGVLTYGICGFNLMYPGFADDSGGFFGFAGMFPWGAGPAAADQTAAYADYTYYADFLFQAMFAATAATIVSGAVAGRVKLGPFLIFSTLFVGLAYPIAGSWKWGGGWLDAMGFYDFAGSSIVHAFGGGGALMGALLLGPRLGKYAEDGSVHPIPGHNIPLAFIGVFVLWLGWFGFNGGSVLSADPDLVSKAMTTTAIAASSGGVAAYFVTRLMAGKPDLSMILNGILAGLVGITAGADTMHIGSASIVGLIAGVIVVFSVYFFDKVKIDDPVGAISVHGVCGLWGTIAVGIFGVADYLGTTDDGTQVGNIVVQVIGTLTYFLFACIVAGILFGILKAMGQLRVSAEEEIEGLDLGEHDANAYPDFQQTYIKSYHAGEL